jgi:LPXTG-motif cell wall-anchored protein
MSLAAHLRTTLVVILLAVPLIAAAAPGAHGPDGEHLDAPGAASPAAALPRVQAQTDAFELVAELRSGEFVVFVDRYETNEPVLGATLVVERGEARADAVFRPAQGDYVVADAAFVKALAAPGEHPLVFTLTAGQEADLLDATLVIGSAGLAHDDHDHHGHWHLSDALIAAGGLLALAAGGWWLWRRRRASTTAALTAGGTR